MSSLVAVLSSGKGSWNQVQSLLSNNEWEKIFLITNDFGKENFKPNKESEFITVDLRLEAEAIRDSIINELKGKLDGDVGLNLVSGTGTEHMGVLSALLKLGVGIRLVTQKETGMVQL